MNIEDEHEVIKNEYISFIINSYHLDTQIKLLEHSRC